MDTYMKKGYLNSEFRLFHLTDRETKEVEYHYHDFNKITIFIKGKVNYMIEGKSYDLKPYDIVLVNHNDIHRLEVDNSVLYERIFSVPQKNILTCFVFHHSKKALFSAPLPGWRNLSLMIVMLLVCTGRYYFWNL